MGASWEKYREKIIGLGENSARKSYYPELQEKIEDLETIKINLQTIIDSVYDSLVIHNLQGKILLLNNQARLFFNVNKEDIHKYKVEDISSPALDLTILDEVWAKVMNGISQTLEWVVRPLGVSAEIPVQVSLSRTNWYGENAIVAIVRDFSERKNYEKELIIARKKAEESDRLKSVFLANLSHEIRTPMNAIIGFSNLLKDSGLSSEKRDQYIEIVQNSGNHLLSIISDIIEISKIETNQIAPNFKAFSVNGMLSDIYQVFSVMSVENKVEFRIKRASTDIKIVSDEVKLRQVITNLLTNAFKFTEHGLVEFGCELKETLEFYVKDTGIGIPQQYHETIFERFRQVENEMSARKGGSGLGLAISKAYVEMLGGKLNLESDINIGSKFWFSIPLNTNNETSNNHKAPQQGLPFVQKQANILVAEDDDNNYFLLAEILSRHNYKVHRAVNGKQALDFLLANRDVDLVLMDLKMPVMNGFESFGLIKKMYPGLPVVAQTAYALAEEENRILNAGFNAYITKPINSVRLIKTINEVLT